MSSRNSHTHKKLAKKRIHCTHPVEPHLVNQLFEDKRIIREKINAPFPVIKSNGSGNDLADLSGVTASDHAMFMHHALTVGHRFGVPVHLLAALAVHGIKADV